VTDVMATNQMRSKDTRWMNSTVFGIEKAPRFSDLSHETVTSVLPAPLASMGVAARALGTIESVADDLSSVAKLYGADGRTGWLDASLSAFCFHGDS
jgi:hypothetical protein